MILLKNTSGFKVGGIPVHPPYTHTKKVFVKIQKCEMSRNLVFGNMVSL